MYIYIINYPGFIVMNIPQFRLQGMVAPIKEKDVNLADIAFNIV